MAEPCRCFQGARTVTAPADGTLVVIGNFDGVHHGHRAVLLAGAAAARERGLAPFVLTFHPHPTVVLRGAKPSPLTTIDFRVRLLCDVEPTLTVVVEPFTRELAALSPRQFATHLLADALGARVVLVGQNFRFGSGRTGDVETLKKLGSELGFEARAHQLLGDEAGCFSSSRVRAALTVGDVREASRVLGRPHAISGRVVAGDGRGRKLGAATANLEQVAEVLPPDGVYACRVERMSRTGQGDPLALGVANIGVRPTIGASQRTVEVHLLDVEADLYGLWLRVYLVHRLRAERAFCGLDELREQIARDIETARRALSPGGRPSASDTSDPAAAPPAVGRSIAGLADKASVKP